MADFLLNMFQYILGNVKKVKIIVHQSKIFPLSQASIMNRNSLLSRRQPSILSL